LSRFPQLFSRLAKKQANRLGIGAIGLLVSYGTATYSAVA